MSTVVEDLAAVQALCEEATEKLAAEKKRADDACAIVAELSGERDKLLSDIEAANAKHAEAIAAITGERDSAKAQAEAKAKELDAIAGELAKARGMLRDPAFAAAQAKESQAVPAGAEGGQVIKTKAQLEAEYAKIPGDTVEGAKARAAFREKHKDALGLK